MSNIVSLDGKRLYSAPRVTPAQLFHHNRALWVCGAIGQEAYFLANILLALAQAADGATVSSTRGDLLRTWVSAPSGQVITGMLDAEDRNSFTFALQQLHDIAGIHSVKSLDNFDEKDMERRHFTRSPMSERSTYDDTTEIFFRLPSMPPEQYAEHVTRVFRFHMEKATNSIIFNL